MALPNNDRIDQYTAVGSEAQFAYTFPVNAAADIVVKKNVSGTITTLTLTTHYTVTSVGSASGGQIVLNTTAYPSGATAGHKFSIFGNQVVTRAGSSDFSVGGDFFAATINNQLDDLTQIAQDVRRDVNLSLKKDPAILETFDPLLPALTDRRTLVVNEVSTGNFNLVMSAKDPDTQEALAAAQVALATTQATNAATSASSASTSASSASTSAAAAATSYDNFDDRFLGAKSSDPTTDNDGNTPIITGALYFNSSNNVMMVYTGSAWVRTIPTASELTAISTVNANSTNINAVAGISANVTTVAGVASDVTTVSGINAAVSTVSGNSSNVSTVAGISGNVTTVAGVSSNVTTVAGVSSNVTTVAGINSDVTTVAGNNANVTTVAGSIANVNTAATNIASVNTTASNIADVNNFASTYRIASSDPGSSLTEGDLVFRTDTDTMRVYNGSAWQNVAPVSAVNVFGTLAVSGQSDIVADSTTDTLTLVASGGTTITTNAGTDTITIDTPTAGASTGLAIAMSVAL